MRIVIDLQGAQSDSRYRGIGRYSMALALAICRNKGRHDVIIALNGMFADSIEPIRAAFDKILSQDNIRVWQAVAPTSAIDATNNWRRNAAKLVREQFIADLKPDVVYITSLFDGYGDDAVHSVNLLPTEYFVAATVYDLIPLIQKDVYLLKNPVYEKFYRENLGYLNQAQLKLAISQSSRQEAIDHLMSDPETVINIGAAIDDGFVPTSVPASKSEALHKRFGITRPFLMYSGATDERKNHIRLIKAFSILPIALRRKFQLVIVGKLPEEHKKKFHSYAKFCGLASDEIVVTGLVEDYEMICFYNLCHLFVFPSWHEGFGLPALEAMSCGAPVIASNTSSLPEVIGREDCLFDPFDENSIAQKIKQVLYDNDLRMDLRKHGIKQAKKFSWDKSAAAAIDAFEKFSLSWRGAESKSYADESGGSLSSLVDKMFKLDPSSARKEDWIESAICMAQNGFGEKKRQLLIDISELAHRDAKSGIQRVVRSILAEYLKNPPDGYVVRPVYASTSVRGYRYANRFLHGFNKQNHSGVGEIISDHVIDYSHGDVFIGLDLQHHVVLHQTEFYAHLMRVGVKVYFVVYDLLPVLLPHVFHEGTASVHGQWLSALASSDGAVCISKAVADEFVEWLAVSGPARLRPLKIGWFHLGADMQGSVPSRGLGPDSNFVLRILAARKTFLVVGTIEPRKGQMQILAAFEQLWASGVDVNLVFVGKHGWNVDLLVEMLRIHSEKNLRLFWLEGISDEYLELVYEASACLIAASEGEGFGLPLIEAAQHGIPIIARDIPVFREVAGRHAYYFKGETADALAGAVNEWISLNSAGIAPASKMMKWLTWKDSTENLSNVILNDQWYSSWLPDGVLRFVGSDVRLGTLVGKRNGRYMESSGQQGYLSFGPYMPLAVGRYRIVIHGAVPRTGPIDAYADVAVDVGTKILGRTALSYNSDDQIVATLDISLEMPCTDLEVRIWVGDGVILKISLIEINSEDTISVF